MKKKIGYWTKNINLDKKTFYSNSVWRKKRKEFIDTQTNGLCKVCFLNDKLIVGQEVDHIDPLTEKDYSSNWKKAYGFDNLQLLCKYHHDQKHTRLYSPLKSGYEFNENGEIKKITKGEWTFDNTGKIVKV